MAFFDIKSVGGINNGTRGGLESINISYADGRTMRASDFKTSSDFSMVKQILSTFKSTDQTSQTGNYSSEGQSCGENAGAGGNAQCAPGLTCSNMNLTTKIGTCIKQ
jgi:hypothetical protein